MRYEVQTKQDLSGALVTIRFPEEELDRKALYTIQATKPDFLVPFHHRSVDGQIECTYQVGSLSNLRYRSATRTLDEYVDFWERILWPLLDCGDWFMKSFSFVLDARYIYVDRDGKNMRYLYVPSNQDCVEFEDLKTMVAEISNNNPVTDTDLENKVLRSIMQDFQPKAFLQMLQGSRNSAGNIVNSNRGPKHVEPAAAAPAPAPKAEDVPASPKAAMPKVESQKNADDIVIDLDAKSGKKERKEKPAKGKGGLFGKKEKKPKEILLGAALEQLPLERSAEQNIPIWMPAELESGLTELYDNRPTEDCLRLVGDKTLPKEIQIKIEPGQMFTIGRFDVEVGRQQSNFEFAKGTKEVSRRHAAIERNPDGSYEIVDIGSKAGTYLDGQKLTPNLRYKLTRGARVSFGSAGAEYVWEGA